MSADLPIRVLDADMDEPLAIDALGGRAVVFSSRKPGHTGSNEDAAAVLGCGVAASMLGISTGFALLAVGVGVYFAYDLAMTIARNWKAIHA